MENTTEVTEFVLAGLSDDPEVQILLFITFSLIYLLTLVGNLGVTELILLDSRLHTPMYFFLSQLLLVDFGYSSAVTPKVMAGLLTGDKTISYEACVAQFFFFVAFITAESFLSAAMAYDRHAAVCKPLHCATAMPTRACMRVLTGCLLCGFLNASVHTGNVFRLSFCRSHAVSHFFCDAPPLLALSCSDSYASEMVIFFAVGFNDLFSILVIFISYLFIFITILRMRSSEGRQKAFSTCASHLTAVSIFYGTGIFMYLQPSSSHSLGTDKVASVFYAMVIPMLNPLVYSLRNKEVKSAFKTAVGKAKSSIEFIL
ncbi:olfactory receptor 5B12-like [Capricornis sumatraensis]|uniref:olfactory receptor 5B12-like n=1 Tax=Capricornis sumatraensis TaxID=34865 RepID=UPI0036049AFF